MPTLKQRQQLNDNAKLVADLVEGFGFQWELDYQYPTPDVTRRVQIREVKHYAPGPQVTQYAAAMRRGEQFPPIVVTSDGYLVDGNTRVEAAHRNKFPHMQAIVLGDAWEGAKESVTRRVRGLGAGFNVRNGRGIDRVEIARAIRAIAVDESYTATRIAGLVGVTEGVVHGILSEEKARARAQALGIHVNGSVPASQLRKIGQAPGLHDAPFKELLSLTQDAGLSSTEVGSLLKEVKAAADDAAALNAITLHREARRDQIAEYRASGKRKPPPAALLRRALGVVVKYEDDPAELVELNPSLAQMHIELLEQTLRILGAALEAQKTRAA